MAQHKGAADCERGLDVAAGLVRTSFLVQDIYARAAQRHELTAVQARLLCILLDRPRGMAELAQLLGVEKAGLTGLVDRVERRGLVDRMAVPGDRRTLHPTLTGTGTRVARAFHAEVSDALTEVAGQLPASDRERLRTSLARIVAAHQVPPIFGTTTGGTVRSADTSGRQLDTAASATRQLRRK